mmetsp:Transcript_71682/g.226487  ORF Transcript_71682/g.226487 Transcript_71682/m.226487 type:complete len:211 (+) Transcript_71682:487-1119(+)
MYPGTSSSASAAAAATVGVILCNGMRSRRNCCSWRLLLAAVEPPSSSLFRACIDGVRLRIISSNLSSALLGPPAAAVCGRTAGLAAGPPLEFPADKELAVPGRPSPLSPAVGSSRPSQAGTGGRNECAAASGANERCAGCAPCARALPTRRAETAPPAGGLGVRPMDADRTDLADALPSPFEAEPVAAQLLMGRGGTVGPRRFADVIVSA